MVSVMRRRGETSSTHQHRAYIRSEKLLCRRLNTLSPSQAESSQCTSSSTIRLSQHRKPSYLEQLGTSSGKQANIQCFNFVPQTPDCDLDAVETRKKVSRRPRRLPVGVGALWVLAKVCVLVLQGDLGVEAAPRPPLRAFVEDTTIKERHHQPSGGQRQDTLSTSAHQAGSDQAVHLSSGHGWWLHHLRVPCFSRIGNGKVEGWHF